MTIARREGQIIRSVALPFLSHKFPSTCVVADKNSGHADIAHNPTLRSIPSRYLIFNSSAVE